MGPSLIQDYGIIGNCRSAALVGASGSIDWLCWPRFDSPSLFAALLDPDAGRDFLIAPPEPFTVTRTLRRGHQRPRHDLRNEQRHGPATDLMPVMSEEDKTPTLAARARNPARSSSACAAPSSCASSSGLAPTTRAGRPDPRHAPSRLPHRGRARGCTRCAAIGRWRRAAKRRGRRPLHARRGRARDLLARLQSRRPRGSAAARRRGARSRVERTLAWWRQWAAAVQLRRALSRRGRSQRAGAEAARLRAVGRHRRGADHVASRAHRRRPQLGLPLLLAARRRADCQLAVGPRLPRRGLGVPRLAAPQHAPDPAGAAASSTTSTAAPRRRRRRSTT